MKLDSKKQIALGAIMSYISIGINIVTGLVFTPWMIHSIGKENYGLFTLALSVISLFVFDFGLSSAITRFLSIYIADGKKEKIEQCLGLVLRIYLVIDIFLFLVLCSVYFFIPYIYKELTLEEIEKFKVIYIMAASFSIFSLPFIPANGILTANEKFVQNKVCDIIHKILVVLTMTVVLLYNGGLYTLVMVNIWSGMIAYLAKLWCIYRFTDTRIDLHYFNRLEIKETLQFSGWITIVSICKRLIFTIAPTILGFFCGSASIAIFGIANAIEGYVFYFADALSGLLLPRVSRVYIKEHGNVLPLMIKVGRIQRYIVSAIVFGFIVLGQDFLNLWLGEQFADSYICIILLILPCVFQLPQEVGSHAIIVQNKVKEQAKVFIIMGLLNIVFGVILTSLFDVLGMCLSIFISSFVRTIGLDIIMYRSLKIDVFKFFKSTFIKQTAPLLLAMGISIYINTIFECSGWLLFAVESLLYCILFSVCSFVVMNEDEKRIASNFLSKVKI